MRTQRQKVDVLTAPASVVESMTVDLACGADEVFAFMWDPQSTFILEDDVIHAMTLPGTPAGEVGEIQATVRKVDGALLGTMLEVLELVPGRRATTRSLAGGVEARQILEVDPLTEETCRLTQHFGCQIPAGAYAGSIGEVRREQRIGLDQLGRRLVAHFGAPTRPES